MRDSVGAMQVFGICLVFIIMFTAYLAISLNYAKAFRIKNNIISKIEEKGGYVPEMETEIKEYIFNQGLTASGKCANRIESQFDNDWTLVTPIDINDSIDDNHNVCIYRSVQAKNTDLKDGPKPQYMYRVVTFFRFDIPVVRHLSSFQVAGESKYIFDYTV